jgi:hypothetical protein
VSHEDAQEENSKAVVEGFVLLNADEGGLTSATRRS